MPQSKRYGELDRIAHQTDCRCHLCGERVDLETYGQLGLYGGDTASVDHLWPQSWGVDDDDSNLRIAHQRCNSSRGTRDPDEYRLERTGRSREPWSSTHWTVASVGVPLGVAKVCGDVFATQNPDGSKSFNGGAAAAGGLFSLFILGCIRAA